MQRLSLCCNTKCKRKDVCMRYSLKGNATVDTWIEFQSVRRFSKTFCKYFIHRNSEQAEKYIKEAYRYIRGGTYETG